MTDAITPKPSQKEIEKFQKDEEFRHKENSTEKQAPTTETIC